MRMFWEKPDSNDQGLNVAFRKRPPTQKKMRLRQKEKHELETYKKMYDLRKESEDVISVLQEMWRRDEVKKKIQEAEHMQFEIQLENLLKEKGISSNKQPQKAKYDKADLENLIPAKVTKKLTPVIEIPKPMDSRVQRPSNSEHGKQARKIEPKIPE